MARPNDTARPNAKKARDEASAAACLQRLEAIRSQTLIYSAGICLAFTLILIANFTLGWFTYSDTQIRLTTEGDSVSYLEEWSMGLKTLAIVTEYCFHDTCFNDQELYLNFDQTQNEVVAWPNRSTYLMTVSEVHQAAGLTSLMFWIGFGCSVVCIGKMCLSLTYKLPYAVVAGCITVHLIGGCLVGLGSVNFIVASADLRKLLESDSVIPDTAPELVFPGYSAFLALSSCVVFLGATVPLVRAGWWAASSGLESINEQVMQLRDGRVRQYISDCEAATYLREREPVDNAPSDGVRRPGWTCDLVTQPSNPLIELDAATGRTLDSESQSKLIVTSSKPPRKRSNLDPFQLQATADLGGKRKKPTTRGIVIKTDPFRSTNSEITEPSFELPGAPSRPFDEKTEKRPKVLNTDEPFVRLAQTMCGDFLTLPTTVKPVRTNKEERAMAAAASCDSTSSALAANAEVGATKRMRAVTRAPPRERPIIKAFVNCSDRPHSARAARGRKVDEDGQQTASVRVSRKVAASAPM